MKDKVLWRKISRIIRIWAGNGPMKACYTCNICSAPCKLKHCRSSKTVTHSSKMTFISEFMVFKHLHACFSTCPHETSVLKIYTGDLGCLFMILWSHTFPVDVCCEGDVPEFCKLIGAFFYIRSKTSPFMDDHHTRSFSLDGIVICQIAFQDCIPFFILNGFRMKFGMNICCQKEDKNYGK